MKFTIHRKSLILTVLEYYLIEWNGCSEGFSESLPKALNEAASIVTGLARSVSLNNLDDCPGTKVQNPNITISV